MKIKVILKILNENDYLGSATKTSIQKYSVGNMSSIRNNASINTINSKSTINKETILSPHDFELEYWMKNTHINLKSSISNNLINDNSSLPYYKNSEIGENKKYSHNTIADLKSLFSSVKGIKIDSIELFSLTNKITLVNDNEDILNYALFEYKNINGSVLYNFMYAVFYYRLTSKEINVNIEYYQNNIDKIIFKLNSNCQIYLLKYLINKKLDDLPIIEQNLSILTISTHKKIENFRILQNNENDNKINLAEIELKDTTSLEEIINMCSPNNNHYNVITFLLAIKRERKCSIGLNFSFATFKNIKKINFSEEAPSYREVSDGLNFFCYCMNKNCNLYKQMFVRNNGYGKFNILKEIELIKCNKCKDSRKLEVRNIGFINSEWKYNGIVANKKSSNISGDGSTIDNKLYVFNEINFMSQFEKLDMLIKEIEFKYKEDNNSNFSSNGSSIDENDIKFSIKRKELINSSNFLSHSYNKFGRSNDNPNNNNSNSNVIYNEGEISVLTNNNLIKEVNNNNNNLEINLDNNKSLTSCCFSNVLKGFHSKDKNDKNIQKSCNIY